MSSLLSSRLAHRQLFNIPRPTMLVEPAATRN